jgi:putative ABC transport system permease protein
VAVIRTVLAEIRQHPKRLLLTGVAIVVATVFAAGILLFTDTLRAALSQSAFSTPEAAAVVVSPSTATALR